ncbi:hypothetical protein Bbelb_187220 [Branchiostoma belcheri]|nr:hypothetical protein Bbelb_187220 [Branchiostoma belcheri]
MLVDGLAAEGYLRTPKQVRAKFKALKHKYRKANEANRRSGSGQRELTAKTNRFLRDLLLTFLDIRKTIGTTRQAFTRPFLTVPHLFLTVPHSFLTVPHPFLTVPHPFLTVPHPFLTVPHPFLTAPRHDSKRSATIPQIRFHPTQEQGYRSFPVSGPRRRLPVECGHALVEPPECSTGKTTRGEGRVSLTDFLTYVTALDAEPQTGWRFDPSIQFKECPKGCRCYPVSNTCALAQD